MYGWVKPNSSLLVPLWLAAPTKAACRLLELRVSQLRSRRQHQMRSGGSVLVDYHIEVVGNIDTENFLQSRIGIG